MKRYILSLILSFVTLLTFAQGKEYFCQIVGYRLNSDNNLSVRVRFGDKIAKEAFGMADRSIKIVDEQGKDINFDSMVDAANYLSERGWKLQQTCSEFDGKHSRVYWIFTKEADTPAQVVEGIFVRKRKGILGVIDELSADD